MPPQNVPNRTTVPAETRRQIEAQADELDALTFSATPTQGEVEALRDAVSAALRGVFGNV